MVGFHSSTSISQALHRIIYQLFASTMLPLRTPTLLALVLGLLTAQQVQGVQNSHHFDADTFGSSGIAPPGRGSSAFPSAPASRRLSRMRIIPDDVILQSDEDDKDIITPSISLLPDALEDPFSSARAGIAASESEQLERGLHGQRAGLALEQLLPLLSLPHCNLASTKGSTIKATLRSTGTTIAGLTLRDGTVILGADTRATDDRMVADKYCSKIHALVDRQVYACGAGTSGDLEALTRQVRFELQLQRLHQESIGNAKVVASDVGTDVDASLTSQVISLLKNRLYEAAGSLGANLIIGSRADGSLIALHPHGSMEKVPYAALGSGGLAAMGVLEDGYSPTLTLEKAKKLVMAAIQAGIDNDLGSGSQVDLCILHSQEGGKETEYIRAAAPAEDLSVKKRATSSTDSSGGVNGFGNLAYEEQSRKTIMLPDGLGGDDALAAVAEWDAILGL
jgi:20S proteasome subunit beta 2